MNAIYPQLILSKFAKSGTLIRECTIISVTGQTKVAIETATHIVAVAMNMIAWVIAGILLVVALYVEFSVPDYR